MEIINQDSLVAPGDISEAPISMTTTEANLTGSWKFFSPRLEEKLSPCLVSCPIHNNIPAYMLSLQQGDLERALKELRETNPLPAITGRVCPHFCQKECNRAELDQEVQIGSVERYLGDLGLDKLLPGPELVREERVAVLGSGPAGLAAAYFLARAGVQVTIFEREDEPGGLLRYGIPAYRLPREVVSREITNLISSLHIDLRLGQEVSGEGIKELRATYDFVFCAPGLWGSVQPPEFTGKPGFLQGLDLLHDISCGQVPEGERFAVVGGGNVAVDVARSLKRLGKEVEIVYRRTFAEMPAYPEEKQSLGEETIPIREQSLVTGVDSKAQGLELTISEAVNKNGRIESGSGRDTLRVDRLVLAVGQQKHFDIPEGERIVIGGDLELGASSVVEAMASGRQGAESILARIDPDLWLQDKDKARERGVAGPEIVNLEYVTRQEPVTAREIPGQERKASFVEVVQGMDREEALQAASRCLNCGLCTSCGLCWFFCPDVSVRLKSGEEGCGVEIDSEHCKGCGLCASVCPRGVISMEEG